MSRPELATIAAQDTADGVAHQVVGAVVSRGDRVLLLRRAANDFLGGLWEFPSGKVETTDPDLISALHREVEEETGLVIATVDDYLGAFDYTSGSGGRSRQHTWCVSVTGTEVVLSEHDDLAWVGAAGERAVSAELGELLARHFAT